MLTRPGVDLETSPWLATPLRLAAVLGIAELSYRCVELPVRRGALGRAVARAAPTRAVTDPRTLLRVVAATVGLLVVGGVATAALAQVPSDVDATPAPGSPDRSRP